jgi:AcrR family transcriptional regulator
MAETEADLLEQAFTLIAEQGWRDFSLTALARRAGVPLSKVYAAFPTRAAVLPALGRRLDEAMLDLDPAEEFAGMSPRERVFELVMRRLDAMAPFRAGLRALGESGGDIDVLASACGNLGRATGWLVDASEAPLGPLRRAVAGPVLGLVYARVVQVWLRDDTPDRAETMAELDRRLNQAEGLARWTDWLDGREGDRREDSPAADGPPLGDAAEGQGA